MNARWVCQFCGAPSVVPSINLEHELKCVARPNTGEK